MVTNGDSFNIGANGDNDDPLETMMIHWSCYGGYVENSANGDNGSNGDNGVIGENNSIGDIGAHGFICTSGVIGTNGTIEWQCVLHISHKPLHIESNDATGVIGAISIIDTNDTNESPFAPMDRQ